MKGKPAPRISAKQLFQLYEDYYQHEIFSINSAFYLELMVYSEIVKVDPLILKGDLSAIALDMDILDRELTALNIELFGLAWFDYNCQLSDEEKQESRQFDAALCTEIMFAKSYLEKTKSSDIWSAAGFYNRTILEAAIAQKKFNRLVNTSRHFSIL